MQTATRILLVEDDEDDQLFFMDAIKRIHPSIECIISNNGKEALSDIEKYPAFDLIFMDLNMPLMNGFECIKKLKDSKYKEIPIVVLTTSDSAENIQLSKDLGAALYCVKPTEYDGLFNELKTILTKAIKFQAV